MRSRFCRCRTQLIVSGKSSAFAWRAVAREEGPGRDERRVQAGVARAGAELGEIAPEHRFAAGQGELEDPEPPRLRERADPVLGLELRAVPLTADVERVRAVRAVQRALI